MGRAAAASKRLACGGLCLFTAAGALALAAYCAALAALLGVAAGAAPAFNTSATQCQAFSQRAGGACGWQCVSAAPTALGQPACSWCDASSPRLCVGAMGNASWAPTPVAAPADCAAPDRAASCSACQYGAAPGSAAPLLACAVGASLIIAATAAAACQNCLAACGCLEGLGCCCCSCGAALWCAAAGAACGVARRALCRREGCSCCGCQCLEPTGGGEGSTCAPDLGAAGAGAAAACDSAQRGSSAGAGASASEPLLLPVEQAAAHS